MGASGPDHAGQPAGEAVRRERRDDDALVRYLSDEERAQAEKVSAVQKLYRLNTAEKVITALKGTREERAILVRDAGMLPVFKETVEELPAFVRIASAMDVTGTLIEKLDPEFFLGHFLKGWYLSATSADRRGFMKARDELRAATLRMVLTAVRTEEVAGKTARELSDAEVVTVLTREAKKRREAAEAFDQGGRPDRVERERAEGESKVTRRIYVDYLRHLVRLRLDRP